MALDMETALSQYGLVGLYAKNNPEINTILSRAIQGEWDSARFERALWDTRWWKTMTEQHRLLDVQRVTDPATFKTTVDNKIAEVRGLAGRLGLSVDANHWAQIALRNGWDTATLQMYLVTDKRNKLLTVQGGLTGQAGEVEGHMRQLHQLYGVPLSGTRIREVVGEILAGTNTIGGVENELRIAAKNMYPQYAAEIDSGRTMMDIAQPYIRTMAATLEVPETTLDLNDKFVKSALTYRDSSGKTTPQPLWEFERTLKNDPRWQRTKQAHNETYAVLDQIGSDWGFSA